MGVLRISRHAFRYETTSPYIWDICKSCKHQEGHVICGLYRKLNKFMPNDFDLDEKIEPQGYCNAWVGK